jgi:hypothetical protein
VTAELNEILQYSLFASRKYQEGGPVPMYEVIAGVPAGTSLDSSLQGQGKLIAKAFLDGGSWNYRGIVFFGLLGTFLGSSQHQSPDMEIGSSSGAPATLAV